MRIAVFGLGYVGSVTSACLAKLGHDVIGVDPNEYKVGCLNKGESPIVEKDLPELIGAAVREGRLKATLDFAEGVRARTSCWCASAPRAGKTARSTSTTWRTPPARWARP